MVKHEQGISLVKKREGGKKRGERKGGGLGAQGGSHTHMPAHTHVLTCLPGSGVCRVELGVG
jgi:hypothetical protein